MKGRRVSSLSRADHPQQPTACPILGNRRVRGASESAGARSSSCGRFSQDSRWIARVRAQHVRQPGGVRRPVSGRQAANPDIPRRGREPRWRKDGREVFYLSPDGTMMAATLSPGPMLQASAPTELFHGGALTSGPSPTYSVSTDGQRFLMIDPVGDPHADHLTVIAHWTETLKQ